MKEPLKPDFTATIETATFWRDTIPEALRAAADYIEQIGGEMDETIDIAQIGYDEYKNEFDVTIPVRVKVNSALSPKKIQGNYIDSKKDEYFELRK